MSSHDSADLANKAHQFVDDFAARGSDFLRDHLPASFIVGTPTGASMVERERFIQKAVARAELVAGKGLPSPTLATTRTTALGNSYLVATATWTLQGTDFTLIEDLLIDATGQTWRCLAYLLRQDLPALLA